MITIIGVECLAIGSGKKLVHCLVRQKIRIFIIKVIILHDLQGGTTELEELQQKLADARQEFDRLLDLSLECDASFLDDKVKRVSKEIDGLKKRIEVLTANQQKAADPQYQLSAEDFQIKEYSDALVARIVEKVIVLSADEIKIEFVGGYTVNTTSQE